MVPHRYRLAGLPGEHQQRNISSPEANYCLVTELIIWTQYEIQVAAYNGAGLGVFSRAVTEYTLQGGNLAFPPRPAESLLGSRLCQAWLEQLEIKVEDPTPYSIQTRCLFPRNSDPVRGAAG